MKTHFHTIIITAAVVLTGLLLSVTILVATDPHKGKDFNRDTEFEVIDYSPPPVADYSEYVQHPITGRWITKEQANREAEVIKALLCNQGRTEYC